MYYSTHGGWWEWAPPDNTFRMPYWQHMGEFLHTVERMSYLLSQGHHRADVAVVYPVASMEAGMSGKEAVDTAFALGRYLYEHGIDFDFMDFESLARAKVEDKKLTVAGEEYRVLVLPAMRAVRHSTLQKAVEFQRGGGAVVVLGAMPEASERSGTGDPEVLAMAKELSGTLRQKNEDVAAKIDSTFARDFTCIAPVQPSVLHRKVGTRDIYMVYGAAKGTDCTFRSMGAAELWDPWSGATSALDVVRQSGGSTTIRMPLESTEAQIVVFQPGQPRIVSQPSTDKLSRIPVEGTWDFELKPTMDNRFGDYRLPATPTLLAAEARRFRYATEGTVPLPGSDPKLDDSQWSQTTYGYGPRFWKLGPLPPGLNDTALEQRLAALPSIDPAVPVVIEGKPYRWSPYEFSLRWGVENDPGHQGYHGLKEEVPADFIALGKMEVKATTTSYAAEAGGTRYYLWTSVPAARAVQARVDVGGDMPAAVWVNGTTLPLPLQGSQLRAGSNSVLLRYDKPGRGHFALLDSNSPVDWSQPYPLASIWYNRPGLLPFDARPQEAHPAGWYRTTSPPGLRAMTISARGKLAVWVDGQPLPLGQPKDRGDGSFEYRAALPKPAAAPAKVAIRVEQERGHYAGAAIPEPLLFDCGPGVILAGDWSAIDGLSSYSGGAWYRKTLTLNPAQVRAGIWLDLGAVSSSAEILVNGKRAGIKLAPPYRVDITKFAKPGANRIEILVYSALSNHYSTIPTRYQRPGPSGLLGPVTLLLENGQ